EKRPRCLWVKTEKGRGYGITGYASHGAAHKRNAEGYWKTKQEFADRYGVTFEDQGAPDPGSSEEARRQAASQLETVLNVLRDDEELLTWLSDRLVDLGDSVPEDIPGLRFDRENDPAADPVITDYRNYPEGLFVAPGKKAPNRKGLAAFGAWLNSHGREKYGRPLVMACSADLADSTNISGFASGFGDSKGWGRFERDENVDGALLPTEITEFTNSGLMCGMATVNFSKTPTKNFVGWYGACSTYGSFSYLKYGLMRLFSQIAQDSQLKVGKVIWVAGHSGPETAEDSRTHFGIFAPAVTQLFPDGQVINIYPYEHNEVAPLLGAALATNAPIIALHLTRPAIEIPDRAALGVPSHFEAARGAYVMRPYRSDQPKGGVALVQGTSPTAEVVKILQAGTLDEESLNIKIVACPSWDLFRLQSAEYRDSVLPEHEWMDATVVTNGSRRSMHDWLPHRWSDKYALSSDWDNRWRTGGSLDEIIDEAHINAKWIMKGLRRFAEDRDQRLGNLRGLLEKLQ
ncbi:MAG: transketolase, partial [Deltaproteobacteria bacterium]|nr:transketolase [Deltaproteobacteria bacterium]